MHVTDCTLALMAYQRRQEPITPPAPTPIRPCPAICPLERQYRPGIRGFSSYYFKSILLITVCCWPELPREGGEAVDSSPVLVAPLSSSVGCTTKGNVIPTRGLNFLIGWDLLLVPSPSFVAGPCRGSWLGMLSGCSSSLGLYCIPDPDKFLLGILSGLDLLLVSCSAALSADPLALECQGCSTTGTKGAWEEAAPVSGVSPSRRTLLGP